MADYWQHWLTVGEKLPNPPKIFRVNWFRKDGDGNFIWPGFGENMRVIEWIVERVNGHGNAEETPIGMMPKYDDLTWTGLDFSMAAFDQIMTVDNEAALREADAQVELFNDFGDRLPAELEAQRLAFKERLAQK
jgi:phosphoenolpyruvate carboxykinase (GTP)